MLFTCQILTVKELAGRRERGCRNRLLGAEETCQPKAHWSRFRQMMIAIRTMQRAVIPKAATMAISIGSMLAYDTAAIGAHATRLAAKAVIVNRVMLMHAVAVEAL